MNTGLRGDSALLLASAKLVEAGITLLKPVSECLKFDLVAFDNLTFSKLQVKRAYPARADGKFTISLRSISMTSSGAVATKYTKDDVDFIVGVIVETNDVYCVPISSVIDRTILTLNPQNIVSKFASNKNFCNVEGYKNQITLNNQIYKL